MWILPKNLHTSAFVPDTAALNWDSTELSEICAASLFVRSKPSPARTWSAKWKRDSWTQHLSGRILKPSHGQSFVTAWTSSLPVIPVSHFQPQESEQEKKTQDISGPSSQTEFGFFAPDSASSRMSKDTSVLASEKSLESWNKLVTRRRGEYSLRVKSGRLTSGSGSSSWPTASVMDTTGGSYKTEWKDGRAVSYHNHTQENPVAYGAKLSDAVKHGQAAPANPSTDGSRQGLSEQSPKNWQTFAHGTHNRGETPHRQVVKALVNGDKAKTQCLTVDQVFAEEIKGTSRKTDLGNQVTKAWATPKASDPQHYGPNMRDSAGNYALPAQAVRKQWGTPTARDHKSGRGNEEREYKELTPMVERTQSGKLNPRWVETLMGLPIGWTMPSCASPVTIALTSCDSSETESSQPQPSELFEF